MILTEWNQKRIDEQDAKTKEYLNRALQRPRCARCGEPRRNHKAGHQTKHCTACRRAAP